MVPQQFELSKNQQKGIGVDHRVDAVELAGVAGADAGERASPRDPHRRAVMGAMRRSNHASVRPIAALSAWGEADPEAISAAIWARSPLPRAISVRKLQPKPWHMKTRAGL